MEGEGNGEIQAKRRKVKAKRDFFFFLLCGEVIYSL